MEHGGAVIAYNCGAAGCADELARAQTFVAGITDAACTPARVILMPDPTLDVRWAATAWTWTLRAECFDDAAFTQFIADHLGHGLESGVQRLRRHRPLPAYRGGSQRPTTRTGVR